MTHMLGLNLKDATDWQRKLLAHTYVFDKERCGTLLLFDSYGKPASDIDSLPLLKIDIKFFAPEHRDKLLEYVESFYEACYGDAKGIDHIAANAIAASVIRTATQSLDTRPAEHRYTATEEEQLQILKVFVEANKYPAVTARLFDIPYSSTSPAVLVAYPDRNTGEHLLFKKGSQGFFSPMQNTVGIANTRPATLRLVAAEEFLHAIDDTPFIKRPRLSERDIEDLSKHANQVLHSYFEDKFASPASRASGSGALNMQDFRERVTNMHKNRAEKFSAASPRSDRINRFTFFSEHRALKRIADFNKNGSYKDDPESWDSELFAKLASRLALRRHFYRNNEEAALERRVEEQLFGGTQAGKVAIEALDRLEYNYALRPDQERDKAERFAEQAAAILDARQSHASRYARTSRQNDGAAR